MTCYWTTMELYCTEDEAVSGFGFGYTHNDQFIVVLIGFVPIIKQALFNSNTIPES